MDWIRNRLMRLIAGRKYAYWIADDAWAGLAGLSSVPCEAGAIMLVRGMEEMGAATAKITLSGYTITIAATANQSDPAAPGQPAWEELRVAIEELAAFPGGAGWHVPREVANDALSHLAKHEAEGWPPPKLIPTQDTGLDFVWHHGGWSIYQCFSLEEDAYFHVFFIDTTPKPSTPSAPGGSPATKETTP